MNRSKMLRRVEFIEYCFEILPEDAEKAGHCLDEQNNLIAVAFKRCFPKEKFARAHGDYYIGIGKSENDCVRAEFNPYPTKELRAAYSKDETKPRLDKPFTVTAILNKSFASTELTEGV